MHLSNFLLCEQVLDKNKLVQFLWSQRYQTLNKCNWQGLGKKGVVPNRMQQHVLAMSQLCLITIDFTNCAVDAVKW